MKLFLIYSLLYLTLIESDCPKGFEELPRQDGCVIAVGRDEFYEDVIRYCYALKAIPAKILNVFDNSYVFALLQTVFDATPAYIGVEKKPNDVWTFADGSPLTYNNWALNEPRSSNSSICAIMDPESGRWYAAECSYARPFFCSVDETSRDSSTLVPATQSSMATQAISTTPPRPPTTDSPLSRCPVGWTYSDETGYCYFVSAFVYVDSKNWRVLRQDQGENYCQSMNSHLVSIHSSVEDIFVQNLIRSTIQPGPADSNVHCDSIGAWIGYIGNGEALNGLWLDGTPVNYIGALRVYPDSYKWSMINDPTCIGYYTWYAENNGTELARYVCKTIPYQVGHMVNQIY